MTPPWHHISDTHLVRKLTVGPYENNTYVVPCSMTRQAVIIDAAAEPEVILSAVTDVTPTAIVTTHGHQDHIGAARAVATALDIPFQLHPEDDAIAGITTDGPIPMGTIELGETQLEAVHTPGHTPGSTSIVIDGAVFTGDTLFPGGPGATRFPYADFDQIIASIRDELFSLPGDTLVFPGHGLDTTIATEKPHLGEWVARGW